MKWNSQKILMVGPMPSPGNYVGGIATMLSHCVRSWDLPYEIVTYNTNTVPRQYASVNRLNITNVRRFFRNALDLVKLVRSEKPVIVHFHTSRHLALLKDLLLVALVKLAAGCKVIGHIHHASYPTLLVGRSNLGRVLQVKLLMASFDRIVLMSESIKLELSAKLSRQSRDRFNAKAKVLYNFTPIPEPASAHSTTSDKVTVFFIGNLGKAKGVFDLIDCAAQLKQSGLGAFELVLAGPFDSPAEGERINGLIKALGLTEIVRLTGSVAGAVKESLFAAADIFALPSYAEGVPISMLEAMAYSLPVIASDVGGISEIMEDGRMGLLIQPGDIQGLASAMRQLILSPELRKEMGTRGRTRVEEFHTTARFLRELDRLYQELADVPLVKSTVEVKSPA
jgi:glycosyltransferase involved in cell wall biosynthesis